MTLNELYGAMVNEKPAADLQEMYEERGYYCEFNDGKYSSSGYEDRENRTRTYMCDEGHVFIRDDEREEECKDDGCPGCGSHNYSEASRCVGCDLYFLQIDLNEEGYCEDCLKSL